MREGSRSSPAMFQDSGTETETRLRTPTSVISQMNENLYIGSLLSATELRNIAPEGSSWLVVSVVSAPAMLALVHEQLRSVRSCRSDLKVKHVEYKLKDKLDEVFVSLRLEEVLQEMDAVLLGHSNSESHRQCCLVHCVMGQSRSAAVIAAWLVSREGTSLEGALDKIRSARPAIHPNMSFIAGLRAIEQRGSVEGAIHRLAGRSAASSSDKR